MAAPSLLEFELANVCLTKIRRQPNPRQALRSAFQLANRLRVETVAVDIAATLDLVETAGLTAYDASYLWLARVLGVELVTLDRKLAAARCDTRIGVMPRGIWHAVDHSVGFTAIPASTDFTGSLP